MVRHPLPPWLEQPISYTDGVPSSFPDSEAAAMLGLQTYVTVPLVNADGDLEGTLCGEPQPSCARTGGVARHETLRRAHLAGQCPESSL